MKSTPFLPNAPSFLARFSKGFFALGIAFLVDGVPQAHGQIVYTSVNASVTTSHGVTIIDHQANPNEGSLSLNFSGGTYTLSFNANGPSAFVIQATAGGQFPPVLFGYGAVIDHSTLFTNLTNHGQMDDAGNGGSWISSSPSTSTRGYVAFSTDLNHDSPNTYYGWIDLQITTAAGGHIASNGVYVYGYAYESSAGTGITAGAIPEPGSSTAIIAAVAGLLALYLRHRKSVVVNNRVST